MKQLSLSPEKFQKIADVFQGIVDGMEQGAAINRMLEHFDERFWFCPASNKVMYHSCYPGGLMEHSLRVYGHLKHLVVKFGDDITDESVKMVALFHDIGKVGTIDDPYFIPQENEWRRDNLGEIYLHNDELVFLDTAQRSIRTLEHFGVKLTDDEYQAILIHDGQYIDGNKRYAHKETMLALLLHQADMIACKQEHLMWKKHNGE